MSRFLLNSLISCGIPGPTAFDAASLFGTVFAPQPGEVLTIMHDLPHGNIADRPAWTERISMAQEWWERISGQAERWNIKVNPLVTYLATGYNNGELPETCAMGGMEKSIADIMMQSTMIMAMTQFSASAPLSGWLEKNTLLRVASMPGVLKSMEASALSADYSEVGKKCVDVGQIFDQAVSADVVFSTGHQCTFDLQNITCRDDGILHPSKLQKGSLSNLPAGEVCIVPKNAEGELPHIIDGALIVYGVRDKMIVDIKEEGPIADERRAYFALDPARCNIAEFAVGVNKWADGASPVTVEAEKAPGIHWAYGRDKHIPGGTVGAEHFLSPEYVVHQDIVYAKGRPIICSKLIMHFADGTSRVLIKDGNLLI